MTEGQKDDKSEKVARVPRYSKRRTKFQQRWLHEDEKDKNGDKLRTYIVPDEDDKYRAICSVCYKSIKIDNLGKFALTQHARSFIHKKRMDEMKRGQMLENQMC